MTTLTSVAAASLAGSLHCAGMCGPFVVMSRCGTAGSGSGAGSLLAYHVGRLMTYLVLATMAGVAGQVINQSGEDLGVSKLSAMLAGGAMLLAGVCGMVRLLGVNWPHPPISPLFRRTLSAGFRRVTQWNGLARAGAIGFLTTWLPCGWLYAFVLLAAGAGSIAAANLILVAFWLGTVPLLSAVDWGARLASARWRAALPWATVVLMLISGSHLLLARAQADFEPLRREMQPRTDMTKRVQQAIHSRPPCCHVD